MPRVQWLLFHSHRNFLPLLQVFHVAVAIIIAPSWSFNHHFPLHKFLVDPYYPEQYFSNF